MVRGAEKLATLGSKRAIMDGWGKGCVKTCREMCVWKGAFLMICGWLVNDYLTLKDPRQGVTNLSNMIMEPLSALFSIGATKVSCVVARQVLQHVVHASRRHSRKQRLH